MGEFYYNSELLTNYLLGKLPAAERDKVEEEYFCNNEVFAALLDAKDQLISDYWNDKLIGDDRLRFERHFLTLPASKQEVELAHFFRPTTVSPPINDSPVEVVKPSWFLGLLNFAKMHQMRIGLATAAVLVAASLLGWQMLKQSPQPLGAGVGSSNTEVPPGEEIVVLPLKPHSPRSSAKNTTAKIGKATRIIELNLEVPAESFHGYQASLRNKDQEDIEVLKENLPGPAKEEDGKPIVTWQISAARLPAGDYMVKLSGIGADGVPSTIGNYDFEVRNQAPENIQTGR